jgi:transposase
VRSVPDGHHISDKVFQLLEPLLPGPKDVWGRIAKNNRPFITELFWIFSTGAAWPDLAERYGDGAIPPVDLLGGEIRVVNDRGQSDQS